MRTIRAKATNAIRQCHGGPWVHRVGVTVAVTVAVIGFDGG